MEQGFLDNEFPWSPSVAKIDFSCWAFNLVCLKPTTNSFRLKADLAQSTCVNRIKRIYLQISQLWNIATDNLQWRQMLSSVQDRYNGREWQFWHCFAAFQIALSLQSGKACTTAALAFPWWTYIHLMVLLPSFSGFNFPRGGIGEGCDRNAPSP